MLDPNIIMGGQQLNVLGAMEAGRAAAESQIGLNRQNALASLYKTQGPQIMAGDANALNALARFDPGAAVDVQSTQLGMQNTRQTMAFSQEKMEIARAEAKANAAAAIQERAEKMSAQEAAAEAAKVEKGVAAAMAAQTPEQWDAMARQFGVPDLVGQFANREAIAGSYMGVADALKEFTPKVAEPADEYQRYVQEENTAGRQPLGRIEFENAKKGKGVSYTTQNPDGSVTSFSMGGATTGTGEPTVGQVYNPNEISSVVTMIDEIAKDPNLPSVVGQKAVLLGGGNQVSELNLPQRIGYGQGGISTIERIGQLQSNAWLSARAMLKGGGAITDYESKKAEAAVARLERPKSVEDFQQALQDLRDAITEGEAKLRNLTPQQASPAKTPAPARAAPVVIDGFTIEAVE